MSRKAVRRASQGTVPKVHDRASGTRQVSRRWATITVQIPRMRFIEGPDVPGESPASQRPTRRVPAPTPEFWNEPLGSSTTLELSLEDVPFVKRRPGAKDIDHVTGFVLAQIDGMSTVDTVLDVCGLPRGRALEVIARLFGDGIIGFR